MSKAVVYRVELTHQGILAFIAKLPRILSDLAGKWRVVDLSIREHEPKRSDNQNRLQWDWCNQASQQLNDQTPEDYQAYLKLHVGMAILCRDSEEYADACRRVLGSLTYEQKLALMKHPFDWPVTRAMNKKQMKEYLDRCWEFFTSQGVRLTDPSLRGMDDWRECA